MAKKHSSAPPLGLAPQKPVQQLELRVGVRRLPDRRRSGGWNLLADQVRCTEEEFHLPGARESCSQAKGTLKALVLKLWE